MTPTPSRVPNFTLPHIVKAVLIRSTTAAVNAPAETPARHPLKMDPFRCWKLKTGFHGRALGRTDRPSFRNGVLEELDSFSRLLGKEEDEMLLLFLAQGHVQTDKLEHTRVRSTLFEHQYCWH